MAAALPSPSSSAYCLQAGTAPFRSAVAAWCHRRFGVTVDPDCEVQLLIGSQEGTAHLPLAVLDPGDAALLLDPCYPSHRGGLILADADIRALPLREADDWRPDLESLPGSAWDRLRLFVLGYPHNPTARVGDQDLLDQVMAKGVRHQLVIAHDNPYVDLALEGEAPSLLCSPGWRSWGIEFFSLSKGWGLGGFRLAFAVGAPPLIEALGQVKAVVDFNQSLALQRGGITALTQCADWPQCLRTTYRARRDGVLAALAERKWGVPCPEMGMYLWMPLPSRAVERGLCDEQVASDLLRRSGVALTPGSGFGSQGSGWLRMALVRPVEELQLAVDRLAEALAALA
jgi:aspartate/methionine/tyrosine aminotransferase